MFKILVTAFMLSGILSAGALTFTKGSIEAHTEVFGDSGINPSTTTITSNLLLGSNLTQLSGTISIPSMSLKSDNDGRDEHMHEAIHVDTEKLISVKLTKVQKTDALYEVYADLTLNGVTKQIVSLCKMQESGNNLNLDGNFSIKMTDYNIEQPSMFFFTVRDEVDVKYNLNYKK
jgi:polyisoprenoid-binding protein YceI